MHCREKRRLPDLSGVRHEVRNGIFNPWISSVKQIHCELSLALSSSFIIFHPPTMAPTPPTPTIRSSGILAAVLHLLHFHPFPLQPTHSLLFSLWASYASFKLGFSKSNLQEKSIRKASEKHHFHFGARKGQCLCCHMQHSLINIQKTRLSPLVVRHPRLAMYKRTGFCSSVDPAQQVVRQNHWLDCKLPGGSSQRLWDGKSKTFAKACWILLMPSRFKLSSSVAANRDLLWPQGSGISMLIQVFAKIRHLVM